MKIRWDKDDLNSVLKYFANDEDFILLASFLKCIEYLGWWLSMIVDIYIPSHLLLNS